MLDQDAYRQDVPSESNIEMMRDEMKILIRQRDELLAALEHVKSAWSEQFEKHGHIAPAWARHVKEAIKKVKVGE